MGKTRELCKKTGDNNGIFPAKMGTINNRNGKDLTKAEEIKNRGTNTQKNCTKKALVTWIIMIVWSLT